MSPPDAGRPRARNPGADNPNSSVASERRPHGSAEVRQLDDQLSLDDLPPVARVTDPPTAWASAKDHTGRRARQIERVVVVVAARGSAICADVVRALGPGADRGCTAKRLGDAERKGLLRVDGVRRAPSGRWQQVYYPTSAGLRLAAQHVADVS